MSHRVTESLPQRSANRRPTRLRAIVESLDTRLLMASGITGTVEMINGTTGGPLPVLGNVSYPTSEVAFAPVGTPVPLVELTSSATGPLSSTGYSGTVNWGDGSPVDSALFGTFIPAYTSFQVPPANTLQVNGPDHTYKTPGTYPVTISVNEPGDSAPTVFHATATITLGIEGKLNPASDTGYFNNDYVTSINTPNFSGTTEPGASVVLSATSNATGQTLIVGTGVADASGAWSVTTVPFADGTYAINAKATDPSGNTANALLAGRFNEFSTQFLVIDATGPKITSFKVTNAKTGAFKLGLSDPVGLFVGPLTDPTTYVVGRTSPTPRRGQTFPVANLTLTPPVTPTIASAPLIASTVTVTGTLGNGKRLTNGVYTYTIHSSSIVSLSGASLDGEYLGKFPTGNGVAGGDFQVKVNIRNGKASGPIAITPITPKATYTVAKAKAAAAKHQV